MGLAWPRLPVCQVTLPERTGAGLMTVAADFGIRLCMMARATVRTTARRGGVGVVIVVAVAVVVSVLIAIIITIILFGVISIKSNLFAEQGGADRSEFLHRAKRIVVLGFGDMGGHAVDADAEERLRRFAAGLGRGVCVEGELGQAIYRVDP